MVLVAHSMLQGSTIRMYHKNAYTILYHGLRNLYLLYKHHLHCNHMKPDYLKKNAIVLVFCLETCQPKHKHLHFCYQIF